MSLKRRASGSGSSSSSTVSLEICALALRYPTMWEFLSLSQWEDGSVRSTGTILLFQETGQVKACLHDRDAGVSTFVSATSLTRCLDAVEAGLDGDSLDWRARGGPKARR